MRRSIYLLITACIFSCSLFVLAAGDEEYIEHGYGKEFTKVVESAKAKMSKETYFEDRLKIFDEFKTKMTKFTNNEEPSPELENVALLQGFLYSVTLKKFAQAQCARLRAEIEVGIDPQSDGPLVVPKALEDARLFADLLCNAQGKTKKSVVKEKDKK